VYGVKPTVTVIISTYNRAHLVCRAIGSVLSQTFHDWELIVVDDASTDNTKEVFYGLQDSRIYFIRHEARRGGSAARNTGIRKARGEYIAFLDSDDEWLPTKLQKQLELFSRSPEQVGLIYTGAIQVYRTRIVKQPPSYKGTLYRKLLLENVVGGASTAMIRKSILTRVNGFDEELPSRQDVDLWLRISKYYQIDFVPECLVKIYNCDDSERITLNNLKVLNGRILFYYKYKEDLQRERLAHAYLRRLGRKFQNRQDVLSARRWYIESIKENPLSLPSYLHLLLSLLPKPIYNTMELFRRCCLGLFFIQRWKECNFLQQDKTRDKENVR
jgi:glycosyltransferase involved in cell wall biosynthesis